MNDDLLNIGDRSFARGESGVVDLTVGRLVSHDELEMRVHVFRGKSPGPRLFVCAGVHGDELNGIEIARRLMRQKMTGLQGDLLIVPVVNPAAFIYRSRYLPDRRDLNRLFPGNSDGSFGARVARTLIDEVVKKCTHGIDLHTAAMGRINLPQTRMVAGDADSAMMARAFGAPVAMESRVREGSLRATCAKLGVPYLLFEAGEASRLELPAVAFGRRGVRRVMAALGMIKARKSDLELPVTRCQSSYWARAQVGGLFRAKVPLGAAVRPGQQLGKIGDPMSNEETIVTCNREGVVIGRTASSLVDEGDALFHLGQTEAATNQAALDIARSAEMVLPENERPAFRDSHNG